MPYCEKCGNQINPDARFCKSCGAKLNPTIQTTPAPAQPAAYTPPPPPPQVAPTPAPQVPTQNVAPAQPQPSPQRTSSEQIIGAVVLRKPKSFGRWDTFTGVLTSQQFIIAQMTSNMVKDAAMQARDQAKAEGKGFFGQWSEQLKASFGYTKRYLTMEPYAIIAETPGNFAINNNTIREIKLKLKHLNYNDDSNRKEWEVEIHSNAGKYEYKMDDNSQFVDLFKKAYPDRVKLPMGYFSKTINIRL
jgi:hypothetical protein